MARLGGGVPVVRRDRYNGDADDIAFARQKVAAGGAGHER
jgi:hypothetical protein